MRVLQEGYLRQGQTSSEGTVWLLNYPLLDNPENRLKFLLKDDVGLVLMVFSPELSTRYRRKEK
jgi:hypothetical protein